MPEPLVDFNALDPVVKYFKTLRELMDELDSMQIAVFSGRCIDRAIQLYRRRYVAGGTSVEMFSEVAGKLWRHFSGEKISKRELDALKASIDKSDRYTDDNPGSEIWVLAHETSFLMVEGINYALSGHRRSAEAIASALRDMTFNISFGAAKNDFFSRYGKDLAAYQGSAASQSAVAVGRPSSFGEPIADTRGGNANT